ncbi:COP9 signalosome complex subunit 8 [Armadillidium vulgare]|nr:COP9 signalosome complex subunit 8 [Armadillidium vulgare]
MEALKEKLSERAINLVSLAYASIGLDDLAQILNLNREDALARAKELLWTFDQATQMVFPTKPKPKMHAPLPSEDQLRRLTEYVSFLEN